MQLGYRRVARQTPVYDNEAHGGPIQIDLTGDIAVVPAADLAGSSQEALEKSTGTDEWAEMEAQGRNEETMLCKLSILQDEDLVDNE